MCNSFTANFLPIRLFNFSKRDVRQLGKRCHLLIQSKYSQHSRLYKSQLLVQRHRPLILTQNLQQILRDSNLFQLRHQKRKQLFRDAPAPVFRNNTRTCIVSRLFPLPHPSAIHVEPDHLSVIKRAGAEFESHSIACDALFKLLARHLHVNLVVGKCFEKTFVEWNEVGGEKKTIGDHETVS